MSVSEVAEQTRISGHYLTCIENDDYRTLPGGIFNKGFRQVVRQMRGRRRTGSASGLCDSGSSRTMPAFRTNRGITNPRF
ncbi:MAG: helix-turn-helix domain-containing protein [Acidobacteria bacterium]|nr:helix-turn-helix domain-containing protein [Acidobacteriota bacterium]